MPDEGEERTIIKFAWWPKTITTKEGTYKLWMERYIVKQRYEFSYLDGPKWIDRGHYLYSKLYETMYITDEDGK